MSAVDIERRTQACKQAMIRELVNGVCDLPHAGSNTNWGDAITQLVANLSREVDTVLNQIRDAAAEQMDWHENGRRKYAERQLQEAIGDLFPE